MPAVRIRAFRSTDRQEIEEVMRSAISDAGAYFPSIEDQDGDPALQESYYRGPGCCLLVAEADGQLIGTAGMRRPDGRIVQRHGDFPPTVGELKRMHVRPAWQRQGIGRKLLAAISREGRKAGYETFVLSTTTVQCGAHAFYERYGFDRFDEERIPDRPFDLVYYRGEVRRFD